MKNYEKIKKFDKVLKHFHTVEILARCLKISRSAIYKWKKIPEKQAYIIEKKTNGKIKASSLLT